MLCTVKEAYIPPHATSNAQKYLLIIWLHRVVTGSCLYLNESPIRTKSFWKLLGRNARKQWQGREGLREFKIDLIRIRKWRKRKRKWLPGRGRKANNEDMEDTVFSWITDMAAKYKRLAASFHKEKRALKWNQQCAPADCLELLSLHYKHHQASCKLLERWIQR